MRTRYDFAFQFGLGEIHRRFPRFPRGAIGAFDHGVDTVPAIPHRGGVPFGIENHVRGARVITRFGDGNRRQPFSARGRRGDRSDDQSSDTGDDWPDSPPHRV